MADYKVEIGDDKTSAICHCCGRVSLVGHGFVYRDGDAYAVYYAGWSETHLHKKVSIAIAIGEWGEDSSVSDRTCFGIEALEDEDKIFLKLSEPNESPWSNTDLLGPMLTRGDGLSHPLLKEVLLITEEILRSHTALREYLAMR